MPTNDSNFNEENEIPVKENLGGATTASETFDRVGTAASEFNDAGANRLGALGADALALDDADDDSPLRWLIPLLLLGLLIISGYVFCGKSESTAATTTTTTTTTAPAVNANANKTIVVVSDGTSGATETMPANANK